MKIAKADPEEMDFAQTNEYPVVFKWPAQNQPTRHVYLTVGNNR